jgi:hypothetical protein
MTAYGRVHWALGEDEHHTHQVHDGAGEATGWDDRHLKPGGFCLRFLRGFCKSCLRINIGEHDNVAQM